MNDVVVFNDDGVVGCIVDFDGNAVALGHVAVGIGLAVLADSLAPYGSIDVEVLDGNAACEDFKAEVDGGIVAVQNNGVFNDDGSGFFALDGEVGCQLNAGLGIVDGSHQVGVIADVSGLHVICVQEGDGLCAGDRLTNAEGIGGDTCGDTQFHCPLYGLCVPSIGGNVGKCLVGGDCGSAQRLVEEGYELLTGTGLIDTEAVGGDTCGNACLHCPQYGSIEPVAFVYVGEGICIGLVSGGAHSLVQEGDGFCAGGDTVGSEQVVANAACDAAVHCPDNRLCVPSVGRYVVKGGGGSCGCQSGGGHKACQQAQHQKHDRKGSFLHNLTSIEFCFTCLNKCLC